MRKCCNCETEYDDANANFYYRASRGYSSWCKPCMRAAANERKASLKLLAYSVPPLLLRLIDLDIECLTQNKPPADMLPQLLELRADVAALCEEP